MNRKSRPTSPQIQKTSKHLDKKKKVKVRALKTILTNSNTEVLAKKVAEETDSKIAVIRGCTFTVCRNC